MRSFASWWTRLPGRRAIVSAWRPHSPDSCDDHASRRDSTTRAKCPPAGADARGWSCRVQPARAKCHPRVQTPGVGRAELCPVVQSHTAGDQGGVARRGSNATNRAPGGAARAVPQHWARPSTPTLASALALALALALASRQPPAPRVGAAPPGRTCPPGRFDVSLYNRKHPTSNPTVSQSGWPAHSAAPAAPA